MTVEAKLHEIRGLVNEFARQAQDTLGVAGVYLFGSLIYRDGLRFSEEYSDVDLAVMLPASSVDPTARTAFAEALIPLKVSLELKLAAALSRSTAVSACSMMVITPREIGADIHKDGAESFFACNEFVEVLSNSRFQGLPGAGKMLVNERLIRQCYRFAQKKRHAYLNVAANKKGSLAPFSGGAPLPKDILRHAAMAACLDATVLPGAEYDTQEGLSHILKLVTSRANESAKYEELRVWLMHHLSTRDGILTPSQQLLLAEVIWQFAEAAQGRLENYRKAPRTLPRNRSTIFFNERVGDAFPGKRGIYWSTDPKDIELRLSRLFAREFAFDGWSPIWMFRGPSTLNIKKFKQLDSMVFLFDHDEIKVKRLALCQSDSYAYQFVYVEGEPMAPVGLYPHSEEAAREAIAKGRLYTEEYGLTDDGLIVTREEYDDGAAERDGQIIETAGRTELRCRYLSPVNFLICGQMSPINNKKFDRRAKELLDRILKGEDLLSTLAEEVQELPRRDDD